MPGQAWKKSDKARGLEYREYTTDKRTERVWRVRQNVKGKAVCDYLGLMEDSQAVLAAAHLRENRRTGAGPQTWQAMQETEKQRLRAASITEETYRKQVLADEEFARLHTVSAFWASYYWPKREKKREMQGKDPHVNKSVAGIFKNWVQPVVGDIPLAELSYLDVEQVLERVGEAGRSAQTQVHAYNILQTLYNSARKYFSAKYKRELAPFPGEGLRPPTNNEKTCWLTETEADLLSDTLLNWQGNDALDAHNMMILSLYSGLRFGDISRLTWQAVTDVELAYARNPKAGMAYGIHLNVDEIALMLKERRTRLGRDTLPDELLFENSEGGRYREVPKVFRAAVEKCRFNYVPHRLNNKAERIDFHALRHTFGTWLGRAGVPAFNIMGLMGLHSLKMVQRYVAHDPSGLAKEVKKLSRIVMNSQD